MTQAISLNQFIQLKGFELTGNDNHFIIRNGTQVFLSFHARDPLCGSILAMRDDLSAKLNVTNNYSQPLAFLKESIQGPAPTQQEYDDYMLAVDKEITAFLAPPTALSIAKDFGTFFANQQAFDGFPTLGEDAGVAFFKIAYPHWVTVKDGNREVIIKHPRSDNIVDHLAEITATVTALIAAPFQVITDTRASGNSGFPAPPVLSNFSSGIENEKVEDQDVEDLLEEYPNEREFATAIMQKPLSLEFELSATALKKVGKLMPPGVWGAFEYFRKFWDRLNESGLIANSDDPVRLALELLRSKNSQLRKEGSNIRRV